MTSDSRLCGWTPREATSFFRPVAPIARYAAEATADGPSYRAAFETGRPVSSDIAVWNSNITCSPPWEISGWYGV